MLVLFLCFGTRPEQIVKITLRVVREPKGAGCALRALKWLLGPSRFFTILRGEKTPAKEIAGHVGHVGHVFSVARKHTLLRTVLN